MSLRAAANENDAYDATGNRTQTQTGTANIDTLQTTAPTTTTGNQLQSDGTFIYQYDADGNLVTRTRISTAYASDATVVYSYDNQNRLSEVTNEDNSDTITQMVTYRYNAEGQRVSESVTAGSTTTVTDFFYDISGNLTLTTDGSGALTGTYYYGQAVDQLLAQEDAAGNVNWMISDREQSVREVVQYSGGTSTVVDHIDYNSFGATISESNPSVAHVGGYAGYINDLAIRMLETQSRYYDAPNARFISQDPSGFAGGNANLYGYVNNSPVDMTDPSGLHPVNPVSQVLTSMPNLQVVSPPLDFGSDSESDSLPFIGSPGVPSYSPPAPTNYNSSLGLANNISDFEYSPFLGSTDLPPAGTLPVSNGDAAFAANAVADSGAKYSSAGAAIELASSVSAINVSPSYSYLVDNPINLNDVSSQFDFMGASVDPAMEPDYGEVAQSNARWSGLATTAVTGAGVVAVTAALAATTPAWFAAAALGAGFVGLTGMDIADRSADLSGWGLAGAVASDMSGFTMASAAIDGSDIPTGTRLNPVQQASAQGALAGSLFSLFAAPSISRSVTRALSADAAASFEASTASRLASSEVFAGEGLTAEGSALLRPGLISTEFAGSLEGSFGSTIETAGLLGEGGFGSTQLTAGLGGLSEFSPTLDLELANSRLAQSNSISYPYGIALQDTSEAAMQLRNDVAAGQQIYRGGNFPKSAGSDAQFFSTDHPLTPGFANSVGAGNLGSATPNFIMGGQIRQGGNFVTRVSPPVGANKGGALEIVNEPGAVQFDFYTMPDKP